MSKPHIIIFGLTPESKKFLGISGSDIRFINIFKNISPNKISLTLIGTKKMENILKVNKITFNYLPIKSKIKFYNLLSLCVFSLVNIIKSFIFIKLDSKSIIYSTSDLFWETIPAFFYRPKVKSWIQVIHHVYPKWFTRPGIPVVNLFGYYFQKFSFYLIKKRADAIIVVNPQVKKELVKFGFKSQKIFISANGVDLNNYKFKLKNKKYQAVFLGRLDASKGLNDIVPIWSKVCQQKHTAKLALIGGGLPKNISQLKKNISSVSLTKNIDILGYVNQKTKNVILANSQIFIFPSHEEGWGIAIAEAMSFGLPIVCWELENLKQVFKNRLIYIKQFNYSNFSKEIIDLLKNPDKIKTLGLSNKAFVKNFSWKKISKKELEIIKKIYVEKK